MTTGEHGAECVICTPTSIPSSASRSSATCGPGEFDVLVGINLLREGLGIPEVSLVAVLDADKEGFLRSERSLIQTIGRAAGASMARPSSTPTSSPTRYDGRSARPTGGAKKQQPLYSAASPRAG